MRSDNIADFVDNVAVIILGSIVYVQYHVLIILDFLVVRVIQVVE